MAQHILHYFKLLNLNIIQWSRSESSQSNQSFGISANRLTTINQISELPNVPVLIAISDDSIPEIVEQIAPLTNASSSLFWCT